MFESIMEFATASPWIMLGVLLLGGSFILSILSGLIDIAVYLLLTAGVLVLIYFLANQLIGLTVVPF